MNLSPWVVVESIHGKFIVNRNCDFQIDYLAKTGRTHIEQEISALIELAKTLPEGCQIVDAGANIGLISIPLANAVKDKGGVVHCFEIQHKLRMALEGAALLNNIDNLLTHVNGLGDDPGYKNFPEIDYSKPQDFGLVSLVPKIDNPKFMVEVDRLDFYEFDHLGLLKIDVEGYEWRVLQGARRTLERTRPWCWVEYFMSDIDSLKLCFDGLDYSFFRMDAQNMLCAPRKRLVESSLRIEAEQM